MSPNAKTSRKSPAADSYLALIQEQPLRVVRTRKDYDAASKMIDRLAVRDDLDEGEKQYLDAIEVLLEAYENNAIPETTDGRPPLERLKAAMRTSQTTPVQLRSILGGSQSMVSMILSGQRALSKKTIARLAAHFRLEPGYFL
jgi:antitoxin component HigA of HigAB toxin-antitoxin module